jgi:DNA-binding CsgD family transcriptional regulator
LLASKGGRTVCLTRQELVILRLLPAHATYADIAEQLFVSLNTVKTHVARIYMKLDVTSRTTAIARASELGLLYATQHPSADEWLDLNHILAGDPIWARAAEGAERARARAFARLCDRLQHAPTNQAIGDVIAHDLAALVSVEYSCMALVSGDVMHITHHPYVGAEIAARYATVPVDHSTPLGVAACTGNPVFASVYEVRPGFHQVVEDFLAAGFIGVIAVPVAGYGALGIGWSPERSMNPARTMSILAEVATAAKGALERTPRDGPTISDQRAHASALQSVS